MLDNKICHAALHSRLCNVLPALRYIGHHSSLSICIWKYNRNMEWQGSLKCYNLETLTLKWDDFELWAWCVGSPIWGSPLIRDLIQLGDYFKITKFPNLPHLGSETILERLGMVLESPSSTLGNSGVSGWTRRKTFFHSRNPI